MGYMFFCMTYIKYSICIIYDMIRIYKIRKKILEREREIKKKKKKKEN